MLMGCKPWLKSYQVFKDLGVGDPDLYIPMKEFGMFVDELTGEKFSIGADLDRFEKNLKKMATEDTAIEEIVGVIKGMKGKDIVSIGMLRPPELNKGLNKLKMLWEARPIIKYLNKRYSQPMSKFTENVKSESLKSLLNSIFGPNAPTWFVLKLVATMASGNMSFIKNGCQAFITKITDNYKSLGGEIRSKERVTKILTENNKACGIQLANGETIKGDYIVSASDSENTIYNLLEGKYTNADIDNVHKTWKPDESFLLTTFGINQDLNKEHTINLINLKQPINYGDKQITSLIFRIMNYGEFAPKGKSIIQARLTGDWDYWHELNKDKENYKKEKARIADEVLERLNSQYPGIKEKVEMTDVATPCTIQRFTLNYHGSVGGWGATPEHLAKVRYRTLPGVKNFYMAGQWAFAGGVLPTIYSGKHVIDLINHNF
jgi:phytoene dehydrogenase-like protein